MRLEFAQFGADPASAKIDFSIGIFRNKEGATPVPYAIPTAARREAAENDSKAFMGATGYGRFNERIARLVLGPSHPALIAGVQCDNLEYLANAIVKAAAEYGAR
jgi:aspartate/tyrosine/aromatic aminotransferase